MGQRVSLPRATHSQCRAQTQPSPASKKTAQTPAFLKTVRRGLWSHCTHKCLGFQPRAPSVFKGSTLMHKTSGLSEGIASVSANEAFRTAKDEKPNFEWVRGSRSQDGPFLPSSGLSLPPSLHPCPLSSQVINSRPQVDL